MANLPPRPTFTNLGDGAPMYSGRRHSSNRSEALGGWNSSNPRDYHPYDHRPSTPTQGPPSLIRPWRRDASHSNPRPGLAGHNGSRSTTTSFASRPGKFTSPSASNTTSSPARQQTVYQSGPVMYSAGHNVPRAGTSLAYPPTTSSPQSFASPDSSVSVWTGSTGNTKFYGGSSRNGSGWNTSCSTPGSGYGSSLVPTSQTSSPSPSLSPGQGDHWQPASRRVSEASVASSGCYPFQPSHPTSGGVWRNVESNVGKSVSGFLEGREATSSSYSATTSTSPCSQSSSGAPSAGPDSTSVATIPAPTSSPSGPTYPNSVSPPASNTYRDRPSSGQNDPECAVPSVPPPVPPRFPSTSTTGFLMNDRTLFFALSAAADQPAQTAETVLSTVCTVGQPSITRNSRGQTPEGNVLIETEPETCMSEETSHTISRSASYHPSPAPPTPAGDTSPSSPPSPGADLDENTNQRSLPPLRPSSSASPPPDRPELHPIALTPAPDTTLHLILGPCTRAFLITSDILGNFTAWGTDATTTTTTTNIASSFWPKDDDTDTHTLQIDLTSLLPALLLTSSAPATTTTATASESRTAPDEENELQSHLDALHALLRAMHSAPAPQEEQDGTETIISIAHLWRLSRLHAAGGLGLRRGWIGWLRGACMGGFVARLGGVRGWLAGYHGSGTETLSEECEGAGEGEVLEQAVSFCGVFGWAEEGRRVMGRLAYVCGLEDEMEEEKKEGGGKGLVKPDGRKLEEGACGRGVVGECLMGRGGGWVVMILTCGDRCYPGCAQTGGRGGVWYCTKVAVRLDHAHRAPALREHDV